MSQFQVWCDLENFLLEHDAAINNNNHPQVIQSGCNGPQNRTSDGPVGGPEGPKAYLGMNLFFEYSQYAQIKKGRL